MAIQKYLFKIESDHHGSRLDHFLAEELPKVAKVELSRAKVRKLIVAGAVYLNGARVRIASKELRIGAKIQVYLDPVRIAGDESPTRDRPFDLGPGAIVFEDEDIIVVNKPFGIPTQPTLDQARTHLFGSVKKFLAERDHLPLEKVYVGLHHRLDRDTSGVIAFTKSKRANPGIAESFSKHLAQKTYIALVEKNTGAPPPGQWKVKNYLKPTSLGKKSKKMQAVRSGGDLAETDFRLLENFKKYALIEAKPRTGRMHQIRVHLADEGFPILGDRMYGGNQHERILLHAACLEVLHPVSREKMKFEAPLPPEFLDFIEKQK